MSLINKFTYQLSQGFQLFYRVIVEQDAAMFDVPV